MPHGLRRGNACTLKTSLRNVPVVYWNQGDSDRLLSCTAVWNGDEFGLELFAAPPEAIG